MASTKLELQYFQQLSARKAKWIEDILRDPSGQKLLDSGVDKYSDQAHFIYELLQNADDTNATEATFDLKSEKLEFSHNGTRHFGISNPDCEVEDKRTGKIGDINAIVSYGQSGKKESNEGKIGKFGAGFKSVFQYTTIPEIYDKNFCFKIERQYIPVLIDNNDPRKDKDTTLFILPFENPDKAYEDISFKIESLKLPLLFLNHLETIICKYGGKKAKYTKYIEKTIKYDNSIAQLIKLGYNDKEESLWLFTKEIDKQLQCSVGFFIDEKDRLTPKNYDAFCYFPTKEHTGLKFIVHAPFLLTDSRENIKADEKHNQKMVQILADLTADSLLHLRDIGLKEGKQLINDDVYLNMFPLDENDFTEIGDRDKLSFKPFYESIIGMIQSEEIIPCSNSVNYVSIENAYWGRTPKIYETFDDEKLELLTNDESAKWVFKKEHNYNSIEQNKKEFYVYMTQILYDDRLIDDSFLMNNKNLSKLITIENIDWLLLFYKYAGVNEQNKKWSKKLEIFLDDEGNRTALFDKDGNELLYLPSSIKTLPQIHPSIISDKDANDFLRSLGITEPSKIDQARDGILNKYNDPSYKNKGDFEILFKLYMKLDKFESNKLVEIIKKSNFKVVCTNSDGSLMDYDKPTNLYFKNNQLARYFKKSNRTAFVDEKIISDKQQLYFLKDIGVSDSLRIKEREINEYEAYSIKKNWQKHNKQIWKEYDIDGCLEYIEQIINSKSKEDSNNLWNILKEVISDNGGSNLSQILIGKYMFETSNAINYDSDFLSINFLNLQKKKWLFDKNGKSLAPEKISLDLLDNDYDTSSTSAKIIIRSLGIMDAKFSSEEAEQLKIGRYAQENNITLEEIEQLVQYKKAKQERESTKKDVESLRVESYEDATSFVDSGKQRTFDNLTSLNKTSINIKDSIDLDISENPVENYIELEKKHKELKEKKKNIKISETNNDEDEFIKYTEKTKEKIEKKRLEIESEINQIKREQELTEIIACSKKYSYSWLINLLKKELLLTGDEEEERKNLVAKFSLVEKEENTERTLLLKNPIGKIPSSIEEISDIPMDFIFETGQPIKIIAEAFSIHSYMVKVKLKDQNQLKNIKLDQVKQIEISFKQPSFLLEELIKRYEELKLKDAFDMQENLTKDIDFVFGPPGTGKTTYLADKFLISKMKSNTENSKIIVLTPTNKAADVIVNRILETMGDDYSYEDWLVRFGTTADEKIDNLSIYKDKHVDIGSYENCVLVTTIHRFWYDFCICEDGSRELRDIDWNYIVIDEASMIPLAHILYPLYSHKPRKFVIAGDPFQIQPTITSEEWKDENIYTLINLNEFSDHPDTVPCRYDIKLLMTQYRSIPDVGEVFSELTYNGKLKHNRSRSEQKKINFGDISFNTLNLIKFPVDQYESIYASKRLNHSSTYHVYSALFTYEFIKYLAESIERNNDEAVSIGVISPYRAQADIIEKLTRNLNKYNKVDLHIGTIHSFQGDECDVVLCVMNTPPGALIKKEIFVNNKNIINVAISRARDYLFVIAPDSNTKGFDNLDILHELINIMKNRYGYTEKDSHSIEEIMFDNPYFLEENAFSTSHQNVNIYDLPEKKYEIRAEDFAVDIQIHSKKSLLDNAKKEETIKQNKKPIEKELSIIKEEENEIKQPVSKLIKENISVDEDNFDSSIYSMHFKLKNDAERMFVSSKGFTFIDKRPSFVFKVNYNNIEYFELENKNTEERAIIKIQGKYLNSVNLKEKIEYSYNAESERFILSIPYSLLRNTLKELASINKIKAISDEEMCEKLSIKYH